MQREMQKGVKMLKSFFKNCQKKFPGTLFLNEILLWTVVNEKVYGFKSHPCTSVNPDTLQFLNKYIFV